MPLGAAGVALSLPAVPADADASLDESLGELAETGAGALAPAGGVTWVGSVAATLPPAVEDGSVPSLDGVVVVDGSLADEPAAVGSEACASPVDAVEPSVGVDESVPALEGAEVGSALTGAGAWGSVPAVVAGAVADESVLAAGSATGAASVGAAGVAG